MCLATGRRDLLLLVAEFLGLGEVLLGFGLLALLLIGDASVVRIAFHPVSIGPVEISHVLVGIEVNRFAVVLNFLVEVALLPVGDAPALYAMAEFGTSRIASVQSAMALS